MNSNTETSAKKPYDMNSNPKTSPKKPYETPHLRVLGDIMTMTKGNGNLALTSDSGHLLKT
jgi:hypothetical protein